MSTTTRAEQSRQSSAVQNRAEQPASQPASPPASTYYPFHAPRRRVCQPLTYGPHGFLYYSHPAAASSSSPLPPLLPSLLPPPFLSFSLPTSSWRQVGELRTRTRHANPRHRRFRRHEQDEDQHQPEVQEQEGGKPAQRLPAVICQRGLLSSSVNKRYEANHASLFFHPLCSPLARHHPSSGCASCAARFSLFIRPSAFAAALFSALSSPRGGG